MHFRPGEDIAKTQRTQNFFENFDEQIFMIYQAEVTQKRTVETRVTG